MLTNEIHYRELLIAVREHIRSSQIKAALSVNSAVIHLYWNIGEMIANNQALFEGRNNYIDQLATDIKLEFPDLNGFSKRNLFEIRRFYIFYSPISVQQLVALKSGSFVKPYPSEVQMAQKRAKNRSVQQLAALNPDGYQHISSLQQLIARVPWGHHLLILNKLKDPEQALFYIQQTIEYNWSRAILTLQIEQNLFARQGKAFINFKNTLSEIEKQHTNHRRI